MVTGASGFAGGYLTRACAAAGDEVTGLSRCGMMPDEASDGRAVDLRDEDAVRRALRALSPDVVYHLAALSSVGRSWEEPAETVQANLGSAVSLLEALRLEAPEARVLWVSSCEVYGSPKRLPVSEDAPLQPANPYAVSKAAGEQLTDVYAQAYELRFIRARPFNHAGPGQRSAFILSSLARQAAEARLAGASTLRVITGNPDTRRDFTDVRDVARAYRLLARVELERSRPREALELLDRARTILPDAENETEQGLIELVRAAALVQLGELDEAAGLAMGLAGALAELPEESGQSYSFLAQTFA